MPIVRLQGQAERMRGVYYEVDTGRSPLGVGGMGKVYQGQQVDETTGATRPVAIKFLFEDLSKEAIEKSRREASIHIQNDNLIEMLGFIEIDGRMILGERQKLYYVVSELLWGVSLYDLMKGVTKDFEGNVVPYAEEMLLEFHQNPFEFARRIVNEVLLGLIALHNAGYIHRDIDPSNIMLTRDRKVKLIDFGVAKKIKNLSNNDKLRTSDGVFIGKAEYASPELVLGDVGHQRQTSDIYAVGILLFQCITGHVPFDGDIATVLDAQLKKSLPLKEIKNKYIRDIISKATQKKQKDRYQSSAEMLVAIEHLPEKLGYDRFELKKLFLCIALLVVLLGGGWLVKSYVMPQPPDINSEVADSLSRSEKTEEQLLNESLEMLRDERRAQEGLKILEHLSDEKQYGQATFILSRLYFKKELDDGIWLPQYDDIGEMHRHVKVLVDNKKAHELLEKAIKKENCYDCWAYLEMGLDYSLAQYRSSEYIDMQDDNYSYTKTAKNYLIKAYNIALDSLQAGQGKSNVNAVKEAAKRELERLQTFMVGNKVITQAEYNSFLKDSIR